MKAATRIPSTADKLEGWIVDPVLLTTSSS